MVFPGDIAEQPGIGMCWRCGREMEQKLLQRCPWCFKDFCSPCRFKRGAVEYCSRSCAEAMFHGGVEEDDDEED